MSLNSSSTPLTTSTLGAALTIVWSDRLELDEERELAGDGMMLL
jgi:hypothetical protein